MTGRCRATAPTLWLALWLAAGLAHAHAPTASGSPVVTGTPEPQPVLAQAGAAEPALQRGLPSLGDAGAMTPLEERKLGDRIARELYRDPDFVDDPVVGEYVDTIWRALRQGAKARGELPPELDERYAWRVLLGRDHSINAFALPGGYFGLHMGLVGVVNSRDELASVLAHEMTHITQRHIPRMLAQQARQGPLVLAGIAAALIATSRNPQAGAAVLVGGQAAMIQQQLNFSRDMEREADRIGYGVLTESGFAGQGFVSMFEKLQNAARLSDNADWPYLRSHPLTTQRIADMQQRSGGPAPAPAARAAVALEPLLVAARARVLSRPGVDVLRAWAALPDGAGFAALPPERRAAALYAAALAQADLRDATQAQAMADRLLPLVRADAAATRQARLLHAELAARRGDGARVLALLPARVAAADPRSQAGRPELLLAAEALTRGGQATEAASRLQTWLADHPDDGPAWNALAQAYAASGQTLRSLRAEGEAQVARLDWAGAVDRFRAAQDATRQPGGQPVDHIEASIIDARLRQTQALLAQQRLEDQKKPL